MGYVAKHQRPRLSQDRYDGEVWCDRCVAQPGTKGKLGLYATRGHARSGEIAFARLAISRRKPARRVSIQWRRENVLWVRCRQCGLDWDTGQGALQRAYALRDRDTGRIRLTERLSVRR